jgi:hypothetical protein
MAYEEAAQQPTETSYAEKKPDIPAPREALVKVWNGRVKAAEKHFEPAFKRMRENMRLAAAGAKKEWVDGEKYVVPILVRYINQAVAKLYAKNPTAVAKRKRRLMHTVWDGRPDSLQSSMEMATMGDPMALQLVMEVAQVQQNNMMLDKMAETLELLWEYYINEQAYNYKQQIKSAVRRTKICGVSYIKLGFQRMMEPRPEVMSRIDDVTSKIAALEGILAEVADKKIDEDSAKIEELRLLLTDLQTEPEMIVREGPVFDFPRATEILIDPACRHLKSLAGARWTAQYWDMTPEEIKAVYEKDVSGQYTRYKDGEKQADDNKEEQCKARVYEIWDKRNQQVMTICDGYCDFLKEPMEPDVQLERFWPFFPIVFNEIEHEEDLYPPADVWLARHIQEEYNRTREALREHRIAAKPWWVTSGQIEEEDRKKIGNHAAHEVVVAPSLTTGQKVEDLIQAGPTASIDPNLYEVEMHFVDIQRVLGVQEAQIGGVAGGTATESAIANESTDTSNADNVDDLDDVLTEVAKSAGQLMLLNIAKETVIEIVGPGAVWPDLAQTRSEIVKDLYLEIKAGSSGRPNQAAELAKLERAIPLIIQIPGVNPLALQTRYMNLLDIPLDEVIAEGMPSITAMNALISKMGTGMGGEPTGDSQTDPNQQGAEGGNNAPGPQQNENESGPQPAFPAPTPPV